MKFLFFSTFMPSPLATDESDAGASASGAAATASPATDQIWIGGGNLNERLQHTLELNSISGGMSLWRL